METLVAMSNTARPNLGETTAPDRVDQLVGGAFDDLYRTEYAPMVQLARGLVDSLERGRGDRAGRLRQGVSSGGVGSTSREVICGPASSTAPRSELRKREVGRRLGIVRRREPVPAEREYLIDVLGQLPARQKMVLVLRFYADMSEREIAETLNIRPGTVKSAASRGLSTLRKALEQ